MTVLDSTAAAFYTTLTGGTALTALLAGTASVYHQQAPDGAAFDYVVYNHQGGGPDLITSADMESNLWQVRFFSTTSSKTAAQGFTQVDALLHKKNIAISGVTTFWCAREQNIVLVENPPDSQKVYSVGGLYRVRTTS